ncbi:hypothetical protein HMPREF9153_0511 [Cutibacterium avidum ATCC 25577]|uniref:Uncharacterized protein n=1 Tax=Cutibacterium avidum ATCC 25577 TaxID=997355 RepID=G4CVF4_9ACTN|nr:hypothetical protein HMPREF9153_0511 [Cutibacterium avidum ATCC 25577]
MELVQTDDPANLVWPSVEGRLSLWWAQGPELAYDDPADRLVPR